MVLLFMTTQRLTSKSLIQNFSEAIISALALRMKLKPLLGLFSHRHFPWYLNRESLENSELYIISHIPAFPPLAFHRLTTLLTLICTHAYGALSPPYVTPSIIYLPDRKHPFATWQRLIVLFPSPIVNGQASWSNCEKTTPLQLTPVITLVSHPLEESMASLEMPPQTFFEHKESAQYLNGLMITFSFVSAVSTFHLTMLRGKNGSRVQSGSRYWYQGETMSNDSSAKFDEDAGNPIWNYTNTSMCSTNDMAFTYCSCRYYGFSDKGS